MSLPGSLDTEAQRSMRELPVTVPLRFNCFKWIHPPISKVQSVIKVTGVMFCKNIRNCLVFMIVLARFIVCTLFYYLS